MFPPCPPDASQCCHVVLPASLDSCSSPCFVDLCAWAHFGVIYGQEHCGGTTKRAGAKTKIRRSKEEALNDSRAELSGQNCNRLSHNCGICKLKGRILIKSCFCDSRMKAEAEHSSHAQRSAGVQPMRPKACERCQVKVPGCSALATYTKDFKVWLALDTTSELTPSALCTPLFDPMPTPNWWKSCVNWEVRPARRNIQATLWQTLL